MPSFVSWRNAILNSAKECVCRKISEIYKWESLGSVNLITLIYFRPGLKYFMYHTAQADHIFFLSFLKGGSGGYGT